MTDKAAVKFESGCLGGHSFQFEGISAKECKSCVIYGYIFYSLRICFPKERNYFPE